MLGSMDFYILGLPLTEDTVTQEFLDFISLDKPTLLISSVGGTNNEDFKSNADYKNSTVGVELLFDHGYTVNTVSTLPDKITKNILTVQLWASPDGRRLPSAVAVDLINLYRLSKERYPDTRIVFLSPGSPYLYDSVSSVLMNFTTVDRIIDTKSSADIAYDMLVDGRMIPIELPKLIQTKHLTEIKLEKNAVNIVGCLGYSYKSDKRNFLKQLKDTDVIFKIKIGTDSMIEKCSGKELRYLLDHRRKKLNLVTVAIILSE